MELLSIINLSQQVECVAGERFDGLPDWVWSEDGYEYHSFMPSCVDPTYCETDPPVPGITITVDQPCQTQTTLRAAKASKTTKESVKLLLKGLKRGTYN